MNMGRLGSDFDLRLFDQDWSGNIRLAKKTSNPNTTTHTSTVVPAFPRSKQDQTKSNKYHQAKTGDTSWTLCHNIASWSWDSKTVFRRNVHWPPCHQRSVCQDCSKCVACSQNLSNMLELILDLGTVTTIFGISPGNYWSISKDGGKCTFCGQNLFSHSEADLGLRSCRRQNVDCPRSLPIHQPGWQQMPDLRPEPAGHHWADVGLRSCHHRNVDGPR